jgi:hypothetical protein
VFIPQVTRDVSPIRGCNHSNNNGWKLGGGKSICGEQVAVDVVKSKLKPVKV